MKCPNCGKEFPEGIKFCSECGTKLIDPAASSGVAIGDKNVIAGDVVGVKEDYHIAGNATIIKNDDETKKVLTCKICGKHITNSNGHNCPICNTFVCEDHFVKEKNCCISCAESMNEKNLEKYKIELSNVYADGKVELNERKRLDTLRKELGIDENTAKYLEANFNVQFSQPTDDLTKIEKLNLQNAKKLILSDFNYQEAFNTISPLYAKHGDNEEILSLYLRIVSLIKPDKFSEIYKTLNIDILEGHLSAIDLAIGANNYDEAERILNKTKSIFVGNIHVAAKEVEFLIKMSVYTRQNAFITEAKTLLDSIGNPSNDYEAAAVDYCKGLYAQINGDEDTYQALCKVYAKGKGKLAFFFEKHHKDNHEILCERCGLYKVKHNNFNKYCESCGDEVEEEQRLEEEARREERRLEKEAEEERKRIAREEADKAQEEKRRIEAEQKRMEELEISRRIAASRNAKIAANIFAAIIHVAVAIWMFFYFKEGHAEIRYCFDNDGPLWGRLWHFSWVLGVITGIASLVSGGLAALIVKENKGETFGWSALAAVILLALFSIGIIIIGLFTMPFFLAWVVWFIAEVAWACAVYLPINAD